MEQNQDQKLLPEHAEHVRQVQEAASRNASWGTIIVILVMLGMIVTGAFYAWGQRIAEEQMLREEIESQKF
ncbi:MAG TPA: hypothetical protein VNU47_01355 [Candidatus Paceibacterota bacterium]|nr:hypothetical protein [Candidatus Paceibacterota bacterium]